jgi:hypothetical protein
MAGVVSLTDPAWIAGNSPCFFPRDNYKDGIGDHKTKDYSKPWCLPTKTIELPRLKCRVRAHTGEGELPLQCILQKYRFHRPLGRISDVESVSELHPVCLARVRP